MMAEKFQPDKNHNNLESKQSTSKNLNQETIDVEKLQQQAAEKEDRNIVLYEAIKTARKEKNIQQLEKAYFEYFMDKYRQIKNSDSFKILSEILRANDNLYLEKINNLGRKSEPNLDKLILRDFISAQKDYSEQRTKVKIKEIDEKISQRNKEES